jgi:hypothetical protein
MNVYGSSDVTQDTQFDPDDSYFSVSKPNVHHDGVRD